ncbi:hypothetical protein DVV91_10050 [Clostridium botulinum]|uniref:hypothetical protein n=1 Tax=Clostridium botulinum TaxID=1491 RepID=UPI001966F5A1|nr:hypothetical protein [Clostridium botulinum]MBN1074683.1 hypothetical protein [Clostridium botulinum]
MKDLLHINIDTLNLKKLNECKDKLMEYIKPYNNKYSEVLTKIGEIEYNDYLNNRKINNYPILNQLLEQLGEEYKNVIIDLDEFLGIKKYSSIRISSELSKSCEKYSISLKYDLIKTITKFMLNNNIVKPQYEIYCPRCNDRIFVFDINPKSQTFIEDFENKYGIWVDENCIYCDNCEEEIEITGENAQVSQSDFYKIIRE